MGVVTLLAKVTVPSYYVVLKPKIFQGQLLYESTGLCLGTVRVDGGYI